MFISRRVGSILAARGLCRLVALVLPSSTGIPFVVAATDLIATLPSRIVNDFAAVPGLTVIPAPLPPVEVSPHLFRHPRTQSSPLRAWVRSVVRQVADGL